MADVEKREDGWAFVCPRPKGCGPNDSTPFTSVGWPSKATAAERGAAHLTEHETGVAMPAMQDWAAGER